MADPNPQLVQFAQYEDAAPVISMNPNTINTTGWNVTFTIRDRLGTQIIQKTTPSGVSVATPAIYQIMLRSSA